MQPQLCKLSFRPSSSGTQPSWISQPLRLSVSAEPSYLFLGRERVTANHRAKCMAFRSKKEHTVTELHRCHWADANGDKEAQMWALPRSTCSVTGQISRYGATPPSHLVSGTYGIGRHSASVESLLGLKKNIVVLCFCLPAGYKPCKQGAARLHLRSHL